MRTDPKNGHSFPSLRALEAVQKACPQLVDGGAAAPAAGSGGGAAPAADGGGSVRAVPPSGGAGVSPVSAAGSGVPVATAGTTGTLQSGLEAAGEPGSVTGPVVTRPDTDVERASGCSIDRSARGNRGGVALAFAGLVLSIGARQRRRTR
jgi:hypothetical protein